MQNNLKIDSSYQLQYVDVTTLLPFEKDDIQHLYEIYFQEIGLVFNKNLDADFVTPAKFYHASSRGAYAVIRHFDANLSPDIKGRGGRIVGCVGVRDISDATNSILGMNSCEIKRFFISEEHRGGGRGRLLLLFILKAAIALGFEKIVCDTKRKLKQANQLYLHLGFADCADYNGNPRADRWLLATRQDLLWLAFEKDIIKNKNKKQRRLASKL